MVTARDVIRDALTDIGVLAEEEAPTAIMAAGALRKLNQMIDSWNLDRPILFGSVSYVLPLVGGDGVYTIGPSGDIDTPYPTNIFAAYVRDVSMPIAQQVDIPLTMLNQQEWADTAYKNLTGSYPFLGVYIDDTYPLKNIYINPIPQNSQYSLVLWANAPLGTSELDVPVELPPGYLRAITSNLSIELAPSYQAELSEITLKIANESLSVVRAKNLQINELMVPDGYWYDIGTNRYIVR